ncbi:MAG: riboflavin kinase [Bacteroidales bacterium]|nr:riboflavin kinase [Bacteroidales bacterium]
MNKLSENGTASLIWYSGTVSHGLRNGRTFGYPTANVTAVTPPLAVGTGVYAAKVRVDGCEYGAMLYAGTRPTLGLEEPTLEIYLFDFKGDLYDQKLHFALFGKIRDEQKFLSVEDLIVQLHKDEVEIREKLKTEN